MPQRCDQRACRDLLRRETEITHPAIRFLLWDSSFSFLCVRASRGSRLFIDFSLYLYHATSFAGGLVMFVCFCVLHCIFMSCLCSCSFSSLDCCKFPFTVSMIQWNMHLWCTRKLKKKKKKIGERERERESRYHWPSSRLVDDARRE